MLLLKLDRRQVTETHMRADAVVVTSPCLNDDRGLAPGTEPLQAETLVAEFTIERFICTVLPRLAWVDQGGLDIGLSQPLENGMTDELRAVVGSQISRTAVKAHQAGQDLDDARRADAAGGVDRQTLVGELVDDGQAFELLAVGARVEDEVVGPNMVRRP